MNEPYQDTMEMNGGCTIEVRKGEDGLYEASSCGLSEKSLDSADAVSKLEGKLYEAISRGTVLQGM